MAWIIKKCSNKNRKKTNQTAHIFKITYPFHRVPTQLQLSNVWRVEKELILCVKSRDKTMKQNLTTIVWLDRPPGVGKDSCLTDSGQVNYRHFSRRVRALCSVL